jgi:hypothetical protein
MCEPCTTGVSYHDAQHNAVYQGSPANTCLACGCPDGYFVTGDCTKSANFKCNLCSCPAGYYLPTGACPAGITQYNPDYTQTCTRCLTAAECEPGFSFLSGLCAGTERVPNACIICIPKVCDAGYYSGGCNGVTPPTCTPYTACPANQYLIGYSPTKDGECLPCRICSERGLDTITPCGAYSNTICTGEPCYPTKGCSPTNSTSRYCDYAENEDSPTCGVCPVCTPTHLETDRQTTSFIDNSIEAGILLDSPRNRQTDN